MIFFSSVMYFHFDTHIITQINIQLRLSFFDKVGNILSVDWIAA